MNLYRKTSIGESLTESLKELTDKLEISPTQAEQILTLFDNVKAKFNRIGNEGEVKYDNKTKDDITWNNTEL